MNKAKFIIYKQGVWWHFDLRASNGKVMYTSKRYSKPAYVKDAITVLCNLIKANPPIVKDYSGRT